MTAFSRYELRTTDADAARAFYAQILGHPRAVVWQLHEQALARGAKPHWLGNLSVDDVERTAAAFVERGAISLGPPRPSQDGRLVAVLRDPGGAIVALTTPPATVEADVEVVWHVLNTSDAARAATNYRELLGWAIAEAVESANGPIRSFAWQAGGPNHGVIADLAGRPGVHPHWLYFFAVDALEPAMAAVRAAGGVALELVVLPSGQRACVCDDPQGAAFALSERRP